MCKISFKKNGPTNTGFIKKNLIIKIVMDNMLVNLAFNKIPKNKNSTVACVLL